MYRYLADWVEDHSLGEVLCAPTDVVLSNHDVVQPDILFVSRERLSIITDPNIQGAPDLLIEILSPGNEKRDTHLKMALYEKHGVKEYWIVDPVAQTVSIYVLQSGTFALMKTCSKGDALHSPTLPGLTLSISRVLAA